MQKIEVFPGLSFIHPALADISICPYTKTGTDCMKGKRESGESRKEIQVPQMHFICHNAPVNGIGVFIARNRMFEIQVKSFGGWIFSQGFLNGCEIICFTTAVGIKRKNKAIGTIMIIEPVCGLIHTRLSGEAHTGILQRA